MPLDDLRRQAPHFRIVCRRHRAVERSAGGSYLPRSRSEVTDLKAGRLMVFKATEGHRMVNGDLMPFAEDCAES